MVKKHKKDPDSFLVDSDEKDEEDTWLKEAEEEAEEEAEFNALMQNPYWDHEILRGVILRTWEAVKPDRPWDRPLDAVNALFFMLANDDLETFGIDGDVITRRHQMRLIKRFRKLNPSRQEQVIRAIFGDRDWR